ncbi:MAG: hypothetical protein ACRD2D_00510 [Terriglobales bacterium]
MRMAALLLVGWIGLGAVPGLPPSLAQIERYSHSAGPYRDVSVTAADADAYWQGPGAARLPAGVSDVRMNAEPGALTGSARVDFDQLRSQGKDAWLLAMFRGVHTVAARAAVVSATAPRATLTIQQVWLDGREIPGFLVDAAIAAFVTAKHPKLGRTFTVPLPRHATAVTEGRVWIRVHYPEGS